MAYADKHDDDGFLGCTEAAEEASEMINKILKRDDEAFRVEAEAGMHHCGYWAFWMRTLIKAFGISVEETGYDPVSSGARYFRMTDPATGIKYDVRIKPVKTEA